MSDCTICHNGKTLSVGWKCDVCGRVNRSELASSAGSAKRHRWLEDGTTSHRYNQKKVFAAPTYDANPTTGEYPSPCA